MIDSEYLTLIQLLYEGAHFFALLFISGILLYILRRLRKIENAMGILLWKPPVEYKAVPDKKKRGRPRKEK